MRSNPLAGEIWVSPAPLILASFPLPDFDPASAPLSNPEDQDIGDLPSGVDEDTLEQDDLDTDQLAANEP